MLPFQLRQAQATRPSLCSLTALKHTKPAVTSQACSFTSWQKQWDWDSHLDPRYERCMRRRTIATKIALKRAILRQQSWEKDTPSITLSTHHHASYSKKHFRRSFDEDEEDARSSQSRRHRLERIRHKCDSKPSERPHEDSFADRFEPLWNRLMPDFLKQEMAWQTPVEPESKSSTPESKGESFAQARSLHVRSSHRKGSKPTVQASSSVWDSGSDKTRRAFYDPISGRMVDEANPVSGQDVADAPAQPSQAYQKPSTHSKLAEDEFDHLTASDVRASMGKTKKANMKILADRAQQLATLEEDYKKKSFDSEHDELLDARKTLEALRAQVQILERRVHGSTLTKPEDELDAERPAVFEDGWNDAPQGLQTAFEAEKESHLHGDKKSLEEEMNALNSAQVQEINDGYEAAPSGMQTQYELENHAAFEQEMDALNRDAVTLTNDGYSTDAKGMQTQYEKELEEAQAGSRESLEEEYKGHGKEIRYDDGYSFAPSGLQTAYLQEDVGTLEQELNEKLKRKDFDDGYSKAPIGMQTLYQNEDAGILEKELNEKPKREVYDDGYSTAPRGMQTAYSEEDASTLERELAAKPDREVYDDGYSTAPSGMQTLYQKENAGVLEKELHDKLNRQEYDDGYSTTAKGMQSAFEQEQEKVKSGSSISLEQEMQDKLRAKAYDDGYSTSPSGLETAFNTEQQHFTTGTGESLEQEMVSRMEEPPTDSGYATMPIGLQVLFQQEQKNKQMSLEDELKAVGNPVAQSEPDTETRTQKNDIQDYEDGYARTPTGMQDSFRNEQNQQSPELIQGEGDMSVNVGKFCNNERWYKQSASNNLSEDIQKAQQRAHDRELVRAVRGIYEDYHGTITTEHHQPQAVADTEGDKAVHKALDDHDLGKGEPAHAFMDDGLGGELEGTQRSATISDPIPTVSSTEATSPITPQPATMKWAEPAIYKVVAYDVHKEAISITTTPSNFSNSDNPMSISNALSRLHQPARFIPHFAELQKEGYQVINASRDWLVLRRVDRGDNMATPEPIINPVDPNITRRIPYEELPTGRFASPTGFVNHDPIFTPEPLKPDPGESITVEIPVHGGPDVDRHRHRRVRREEPVFSGSQRWRERRRDGHERSQKRRFRDRMVWVLSVGVGTAACMYVVGIVSELAKGEEGNDGKRSG